MPLPGAFYETINVYNLNELVLAIVLIYSDINIAI
jgi:hypothetical protein